MYYDDEARRFNFVSGLTLGTVLGAGLTVLYAGLRRQARSRRTGRWKRRATDGVEALREGVVEPVTETLAAGRKYFNR